MKKIVLLCMVIFAFLWGGNYFDFTSAYAETLYGRAETANVGFYASEVDDLPMFFIPLGYYVTITGETEDFYSCEYAKTESSYTKKYGFVKKSEIYLDSEMALPMFAEIAITAIKDSDLYSRQSMSNVVSSITAGQNAYFYGIYQDGDTQSYYVKIGGDFGYVEASGFEKLVMPTHPKLLSTDKEVIEKPEDTSDVVADVSESEDVIATDFNIQLAMILCIAVPALIFLFYAFKPQGGDVNRYFE